jgi:two-component system phosphate regulon sensor histidine kinase PhoR
VTLGIRGKLFVASVALILLSMLSADAYLAGAVDAMLTARIREDLRARLEIALALAERADIALDDSARWQDLLQPVGRDAGMRISVIRADGVLVGDSNLDASSLQRAENHLHRPEIEAALSGKATSAERFSETIGERMLYMAAPLERAGARVGAVRLALPLTAVDSTVRRVHHLLLIATFIALAVAVVTSGLMSRWAARKARLLAAAAKRMAEGDLSTRTDPQGSDEFSALGRSLDTLAESLSSTLHELRSERDLLGGILDGMQEGVLLIDASDHVALVNPALREMLLLGNDATGRSLSDLVRDPELAAILDRARNSQEPGVGEIELGGLKPRRLLVRATAMRGEPAGILAVFVDVTELRRLEKLRRDFVANVSHELRTPVTAIRSATETLQDAFVRDPRAVPMFMDIIARNADRMHRLVEDLLDLSRIESREYKLTIEDLDLSHEVQSIIALFRERADKKRVRLIVEVPEIRSNIRADRRALEQILSNLLENAIKYCGENSTIAIRARTEDGNVLKLSVEDSGPGIEAKHLPRLFERFYRIDKGRARDVGGTGLGLSIVKHLAEAMGGKVGVESVVGSGSTFHVTFPRNSASGKAGGSSQEALPNSKAAS